MAHLFDLGPHLRGGRRVALQFSGGKDSLALLYMLRAWWNDLTIYWANPGDPPDELLDLMRRVAGEVPHFVEVPGRRWEVIQQFGWPANVVPAGHDRLSHDIFVKSKTPLLQDRLSCCIRSMMAPMHERMIQDGVTLVLRGQRGADALAARMPESGEYEVLFPIDSWSDEDVFGFLAGRGVKLPGWYEVSKHGMDCLTCSAWHAREHLPYLDATSPHAAALVRHRMETINEAALAAMES
jgi:3'-phosphoadenosine 5'-phosphosulfate sulfotransferase (PAPS reductase)/FAD synthetase